MNTTREQASSAEALDTSLFRGAAAGVIGQLAFVSMGLAASVLIARSSDVADVGAYVVALAISGFVSLLTGLQLTNHIGRSANDAEALGFLPWAAVAGVAGCAATVAVAAVLHGVNSPIAAPLICLTPAVALQPLGDALSGLLTRDGRARALAVYQCSRAIARPAVLFALVVATTSISANQIALVDSAVAPFSLLVLLHLHRRRHMRRRVSERALHRASDLRRTTVALLVVSASWQLIQRTDLLCVSAFVGSAAAGRYQFALRLFELCLAANAALLAFCLPTLTKARQEGRMRESYGRATRLTTQLLMPVLIVLAVWGDRLAITAFGSAYGLSQGVYAVLAMGIAAQVVAGPNGFALMASRRHREMLKMGALVAVLNLGLNLVLVPRLHELGAACASTASLVALNVLYTCASRHEIGSVRLTSPLLRWQFVYAGALVVLILSSRVLLGSTSAALALSICVAAAVFLVSCRQPRIRPIMSSLAAGLRP